MTLIKNTTYYPAISGIIMSIAFIVPSLWFLGFIGLIPLLVFLNTKKENLKIIFLNGLIFGLIFMGSVLSWFWSTFPLYWAGIESPIISFFIILAVWFFSSLIFALFIALWAVVFYKFKRNNWSDILFAPALWILFEYTRAFAFSLLWISPVSLTGPHWTFGFLGYILAENTILLSLAGIGGIYLLGFIVVISNIYLYHIFFIKNDEIKNKYKQVILPFIILFIISSLIYINQNSREYEKKARVAVITTSLPPVFSENDSVFLTHIASIKNILAEIKIGDEINKKNTDIIVLPEDTRFTKSLNILEKKFLQEKILQNNKLLIDSGLVVGEQKEIKSALIYSNKQNGHYYKTLLVPYGEYLPYIARLTADILGKHQIVNRFNTSRGYINGKDTKLSIAEFNGINIGTLFCSEIVPNRLYRTLTKNGANVLVNVASHSVFKSSKTLYRQTLKMAKVHAVSNNRYFVQSINFARSFVLSNKGEMIAIAKNNQYSIIYSDIAVIKKISIYTKAGDWVLLFALFVLIHTLFIARKK